LAFLIHEARHDGGQRFVRLIGDRPHGDERQPAFGRHPGHMMALHVDAQRAALREKRGLKGPEKKQPQKKQVEKKRFEKKPIDKKPPPEKKAPDGI